MGFFTNTGALKEGEIVLSCDRHHLYQIVEGKSVEFERIRVPPGNPKLWVPGQKQGVTIYDMSKGVVYVYNIDSDMWDKLEYGSYNSDISDLNAYNAVLKLYKSLDKFPKNTI